MSEPVRKKRPLSLRVKIVLVSLLSFLVTTACSWLRLRPTPMVTCYEAVAPSDTPTPFVTCYTAPAPSTTPTPLCYTPTPSPTTFTSPLPTPSPSPTPEARRLLRDRLLAGGRFPQNVARQLES